MRPVRVGGRGKSKVCSLSTVLSGQLAGARGGECDLGMAQMDGMWWKDEGRARIRAARHFLSTASPHDGWSMSAGTDEVALSRVV